MSYRELRAFTETMRALGYPRPVSMDNFRTPNFPLVADIMFWLVLRYDPSAKLPDDIDTENQRVAFLTAVGQVVANKARLVLKTKSLYAADGRAVKEMLKLARLLHGAVRQCREGLGAGGSDPALTLPAAPPARAGAGAAAFSEPDFLASIRPGDLAATRAAASRITERGARLHELLKRETQDGSREARAEALRFLDALSGSMLLAAGGGAPSGTRGAGKAAGKGAGGAADVSAFERAVRDAIDGVKDSIVALEREAAELAEDERTLTAKAAKRRGELERAQKRLESLQSVRPAFMDEYERLERELAVEYESYVVKARNLDFLTKELAAADAREAEAAEASARALKRLQRKMREEENSLARGDGDGSPRAAGSGGVTPAADEGSRGGAQAPAARPSAAPAGGAGRLAAQLASTPARVSGRMDAPDDDDDDDDVDEAEMEGGSDEDLGGSDDLDDDF